MAPDTPARSVPYARPTLHELVVQLESVLHPARHEVPSVLVGILGSGDVELCFPPDGAGSVVDAVVGLDAPEAWVAVGLVASGRACDLDPDDPTAITFVRPSERRPVRIGTFVARGGECVSFLRVDDADPTFDEQRHHGRVDDVCRRMLGLATAPPDAPVEAYWAARWLEQVIAAGRRCTTYVSTWDRVVIRHRAVQSSDHPPSVAELVRAGRGLAAGEPWAALRAAVADGRPRVAGVGRSTARWMDSGMFSRWAMQDLAPLAHLRSMIAEVVPPGVGEAVDDALAGWGLT